VCTVINGFQNFIILVNATPAVGGGFFFVRPASFSGRPAVEAVYLLQQLTSASKYFAHCCGMLYFAVMQ
jgi:hypothetical protein